MWARHRGLPMAGRSPFSKPLHWPGTTSADRCRRKPASRQRSPRSAVSRSRPARTSLTTGPGRKLTPQWLPDGRIAYLRSDSEKAISPAPDLGPAWSPRGDRMHIVPRSCWMRARLDDGMLAEPEAAPASLTRRNRAKGSTNLRRLITWTAKRHRLASRHGHAPFSPSPRRRRGGLVAFGEGDLRSRSRCG